MNNNSPPDYAINLLLAAKNAVAALGESDELFVEELIDAVLTFEEMMPADSGIVLEAEPV